MVCMGGQCKFQDGDGCSAERHGDVAHGPGRRSRGKEERDKDERARRRKTSGSPHIDIGACATCHFGVRFCSCKITPCSSIKAASICQLSNIDELFLCHDVIFV